MKMNTYIRMLICLTAIAVLAAPSGAQSTPFVIGGWIFYENDTACDDPAVNITNTDTGAEWQAETNISSNYYQIVRANDTDLNATDILQFNVTNPGEDQSNTTKHTVTPGEIDDGGIFNFDVTLASPTASPTLVEYTINNRTITPPQTTEIDVEFSERVKWKIAIENGGVVYDWVGTSTNPYSKTWNGTHEGTATIVPDGAYVVNITWTNTTTDLGGQNNTETITVSKPPASITDLQNTTYEQTHINWTWTDPEDDDFAKVMVYLDGTQQPDVLKGVQCYNATGLAQDTEYTIATRTVDNLGNINDTWENHTARTKPCAAPEIDLIVVSITPNCGGYLFGNESNEISAVVKNNGSTNAEASNASFVLSDGYSETAVVGALAPGASETVTIIDPTIRAAGAAVTITVTSDCDGEIAEFNETNNATVMDVTVVNNGYKGKTYTGGPNMTTWKSYDLNGNLVYSVGDSYYLSSSTYPDWTTYNASWTASDLPVTGTIIEARLYTTYTWDKDGVMPDDVSVSFNGGNQEPEDAHYWDDRVFTDSKYYGMIAYNVTGDFNSSGNYANLTNSHVGGDNVSMRGMMLVVIYENASEPRRQIFVNEEFDLLYGGASKCTTPEEATAWAPITGLSIDTAAVASATLITVAPGAGLTEGELLFNGQVWTDVWNYAGSSQIGIDERDVASYLDSTDNLVGFQSSEDWMEASNAFLIVSHKSDITPPAITTATPPSSTVFDIEGASRTFSIDIDQTVDVTWLIDGTTVETDAGVTSASYTNTSAVVDIWNVSAVVTNVNGTDMQTWWWTVSAAGTGTFDTGGGTYPSIRGTHKGNFTPNCDIAVNKMYTYPCSGTGGHSEYVAFYEGEVLVAEGTWSGYLGGDYHNIDFGTTFALQAGVVYNYEIVTGSYPQMIHNQTYWNADGTITCTEFIDANGKVYTNRIPAIRLE
jgi:hypothetical protein